MTTFADELGKSVLTADGQTLGHVIDLSIGLRRRHPVVRRLIVGRRHTPEIVVDWAAVDRRLPHGMLLTSEAEPLRVSDRNVPLGDDELLLGRDVIDTQVVDVHGHRLARVADVLLAETPDGGLVAAAVDVGFGSVCRRLGLRRLGERFRVSAVDWQDIHLTSARGHQVQLDCTAAAVHRLRGWELADLLHRLSTPAAAMVLGTVEPRQAADALAASQHDAASSIVRAMPEQVASNVLGALPPSHAEVLRAVREQHPASRRRFLRHRRRRGPAPHR